MSLKVHQWCDIFPLRAAIEINEKRMNKNQKICAKRDTQSHSALLKWINFLSHDVRSNNNFSLFRNSCLALANYVNYRITRETIVIVIRTYLLTEPNGIEPRTFKSRRETNVKRGAQRDEIVLVT